MCNCNPNIRAPFCGALGCKMPPQKPLIWEEESKEGSVKFIPYKCPVCLGRTIVPAGFYTSTGDTWTSGSVPESCRACSGTGVIWSEINKTEYKGDSI